MIIDVTDLQLSSFRFMVTRADGRIVDFSQLVSEFVWSDHVNIAGAEVSITAEGEPRMVNQIGMEGTTAMITAVTPDVLNGRYGRREFWRGFFEEVNDEHSSEAMVKSITAYDAGKLLASDEEDYVFKEATLSQILYRVAADFSIPLGVVVDTTVALGNIVCRGETLWDLFQKGIQRHQDLTGETYRIFFRQGKINMIRQAAAERWWVFEVGRSIQNLRRNRSIADLENRVRIYGNVEDELDKPPVEATIENVGSQGTYGLRQRVEYVSAAEDVDRARELAQIRINRHSIPDETVEVTGWAVPLLRAGEAVQIIDSDLGVSGMFFAESIECTFAADVATSVALCRKTPIDPGLYLDQLVVA